MERERMNRLLALYPGIGVITKDAEGREVCYFYQDFDGPATGIKRAMAQIYPLMDKGKITSVCFVEQYRKGASQHESH